MPASQASFRRSVSAGPGGSRAARSAGRAGCDRRKRDEQARVASQQDAGGRAAEHGPDCGSDRHRAIKTGRPVAATAPTARCARSRSARRERAWYGRAMPARAPANLLWLLAVIAGTALRLYQLHDQVLVDDEWHALHALLAGGPLDVLLSFGASDHSIPLTLYDIAPRAHRRPVGARHAAAVAAGRDRGARGRAVAGTRRRRRARQRDPRLVARDRAAARVLQPLRAPVRGGDAARVRRPARLLRTLRGTGGGPRLAGRVRRGAILAPWLLLVVLPVVAAPLALALLESLARRPGARSPRAVVASTLVVAAGWLACLAPPPPLLANAAALSEKVARGSIDGATLRGASELLLGTTSFALRCVCVATALWGGVLLLRQQQRFAAYVACSSRGAARRAARARAARAPLRDRVRALLPRAEPVSALADRGRPRRRRSHARGARAGGALRCSRSCSPVALAASGPLAWIDAWPNDFTNHASYQADLFRPERYFERFRPATISPFYETLAEEAPGSITIVEAPWHFFWHGLAYLQRIHRQHVVVGFVGEGSGRVRSGEVPREPRRDPAAQRAARRRRGGAARARRRLRSLPPRRPERRCACRLRTRRCPSTAGSSATGARTAIRCTRTTRSPCSRCARPPAAEPARAVAAADGAQRPCPAAPACASLRARRTPE